MSSQTVILSEARNLARGWLPSLQTLCPATAPAPGPGIAAGPPPGPRLSGETDLESYLEKHPHLRHLLQTKCEAVVVGHQDGAQVRHYPPSAPAPLFAPVPPCS